MICNFLHTGLHFSHFSVDLSTECGKCLHTAQTTSGRCCFGACDYDHTTLSTPVLIWSPKLSSVGHVQYLDGWPSRNHRCSRLCLLFPSFLFFFFLVSDFWLCLCRGAWWLNWLPSNLKVGCDLLLSPTGCICFNVDLLTKCGNKCLHTHRVQLDDAVVLSHTPHWPSQQWSVHNYELHEKQFCLPDTQQNLRNLCELIVLACHCHSTAN